MIKQLIAVSALLLTFIQPTLARELPDFTELAETQGPTVVNISVTQVVQNGFAGMPFGGPQDEILGEFFKRFGIPAPGSQGMPPQEYKSQSLGSGFIISADGYILTNAHVVNEADEVTVKLSDKREFKAKIIGSDKRTDVALIKIDAVNLPKVNIGDPNTLKVGEWVAAIGSPFGLESTITQGIVSAKGRALPQENFVPFIQTDVAINPGNSGGPLFNLKGEVVGINSQIYSRSGGYMGLSFAIPIDVAMDISNQLKSGGKVTRGWLGVTIQELSKELAESFGMKNTHGALISSVEKSGPADKSGLQAGDVILKFDNKPIMTSGDLPRAVGSTKPNKQVPVEVLRKGANKTLAVTLGEMPTENGENASIPKAPAKPELNRLGLLLKDLTPQQKKKINGKNGVIIIEAQGPAADAGIRRGDVLLGLNNTEVISVEQASKAIASLNAGKSVALLVLRGENTLYVPVKVPAK